MYTVSKSLESNLGYQLFINVCVCLFWKRGYEHDYRTALATDCPSLQDVQTGNGSFLRHTKVENVTRQRELHLIYSEWLFPSTGTHLLFVDWIVQPSTSVASLQYGQGIEMSIQKHVWIDFCMFCIDTRHFHLCTGRIEICMFQNYIYELWRTHLTGLSPGWTTKWAFRAAGWRPGTEHCLL